MAASQIELAARGQEDRWLTESPSRTFFEAKYKSRINRLRETLEIPFDYQGVTFGTTGQSTIPVKGDYLTGLTLRAILPAIYPTVPGQYVFPTPSSQVGGNVFVDMGLTQIVADGTTLTANTTGNHYFSNGAAVILSGTAYSIFDLDGVYTVNGIPTANSFTCSTVLSGISFNGTVSTVGISCGDVVSYFSTTNSNLWVNNLTNKTWQITSATVVGAIATFTTLAPSNFPVGSQLILNLPKSTVLSQVVTVSASTQTTFTCTINGSYTISVSDSVSFVTPPVKVTNQIFYSHVYPSISFQNAADAAFWGFDSRNGLSYSFTNGIITPPWSLIQSGWIPGFLPPSTSTYDDSVAHKLCKAIRIMVGKQTIKEYSGEYIELLNDLTVDYANKAILKLMNGTLDQTQATVPREYYVSLPIGTREIPVCALTHQNMSVEIDFEKYANLSRNLNPGTGVFTDSKSFVTYDASTNLLNGSALNVQTTFSYQQYIFIVTYGGLFIIYDTALPVSDSTSYTVLSAFSGSTVFQQFCVLSGTLYIGLSDGTLARVNLDEIIQGNISSFTLNNYNPTFGSLTGTMVADFRYVYYAVSNTVTSNVFVSQYDTTANFTTTTSYKTVDFTLNFDSSVDGVYQFISTGTELVMLPTGTPGSLYTYQLNANVQSQWYLLDYSSYGTQITEGVLLGNTLYFVIDGFKILKYSNSNFTVSSLVTNIPGDQFRNLLAVENYIYTSTNQVAVQIDTTKDLSTAAAYSFPAPVPTGQYVFANGPRYVYLFSQGDATAKNVYRFDPYPPNTTLRASIMVDYESLPVDMQKPDKALIGLVQTQKVTNMDVMDLHGPVKELWITGVADTTNVFQYANLSNQSTLTFTAGEQMITPDTGTRKMLSVIQPFEMHTSMPVRNISTFSFEMDPESSTPNGTVNFSRIYEQVFGGGAQTIWARNYNILAIQGGVGGLMFN